MFLELLAVAFVLCGHHCVLRVVGLRSAHQRLQGEEGRADGEGWRPFVFEDVEADSSGLRTDVGMPDLGFEAHLGRLVGVLRREGDVDLEEASLVDSVLGVLDVALPVAEVVVYYGDLDVGFL